MYIRFRHVMTIFGNCPRMRTIKRLNIASFIIGMITVLGVSIVGNFQVLFLQSRYANANLHQDLERLVIFCCSLQVLMINAVYSL